MAVERVSPGINWWSPSWLDRLKAALGRCPECGGWWPRAYWKRQRTCYQQDRDNWCLACPECHKANDDYWDERWADYYGGLL